MISRRSDLMKFEEKIHMILLKLLQIYFKFVRFSLVIAL